MIADPVSGQPVCADAAARAAGCVPFNFFSTDRPSQEFLNYADAAEARRLRDAGIMIISEVVDDEASWRAYLARGVDALFTNDPAALIAFLKKNSTHHSFF